MGEVKCEGCGRKIDVSALRPSYGGFDVYCTICGHTGHIEP